MRWIFAIAGIVLAFGLGFLTGKTSTSLAPEREAAATSVAISATSARPVSQEDSNWYPVVKVIDGDTLTVAIDGGNITIRLIGLDTPESVDPRTTVQCFSREASEKAKQILSGTSVRLETDPSQGKLDKYGRTLAYAFLPDGRNFAELMISEGYGHEYTYNVPYKYQDEFKAAEKSAREQKKGLWADNACSGSDTYQPTRSIESAAMAVGGQYECSRNAYNCGDFATQAEAQSVFESCGGSDNDVHKLDADGDSRVCESLS